MSCEPAVSVVIPILERYDRLGDLNAEYMRVLARLDEPYEVIYVLDTQDPASAQCVASLVEEFPFARSVTLNRAFSDSTALNVGLRVSRGERVLVLPAYPQVEPEDIPSVLETLEVSDLAIGERDRSNESVLNRLQGRMFNGLISTLAKSPAKDMGCEVLALRREVATEISLHGGQHRFLPLLADRVGFVVKSVPVRQAKENAVRSLRRPRHYAQTVLDILTVVFLSRFVKKPLRFFGVMGMLLVLLGLGIIALVVIQRIGYGIPLATRPVFVFGTLSLVAGLQIMGIGLIGEVIIFSRARDLPDYHIKEVIENSSVRERGASGSTNGRR